jgi:predicted DNA-binding transcriptional regulator YafY
MPATRRMSSTAGPKPARSAAGGVLERLLEMMATIPRGPRSVTTAEVDKRLQALGYEVNRRTVVRDLNKLSARFGVERLGDESAYAWRWPEKGNAFVAPVLGESEALALVMLREHLGGLLPPMVIEALEPQIARAEARLRDVPALNGAGLRQWKQAVRVVPPVQPLLPPKVRHAVREVIYVALAGRTRFTGSYRRRGAAEASEGVYNPLGLIMRGSVAYLVTTMWDYDNVLVLPLHRFERAEALAERVRVPEGFDLDRFVAEQGGLGFATGQGEITLRARFYNGTGLHLEETPLTEDQQLVDLGDGTHELTATLPETGQLHWWLQAFGANVEVLAPAALRARMVQSLQDALARYAD